jgi:hypothetical protein
MADLTRPQEDDVVAQTDQLGYTQADGESLQTGSQGDEQRTGGEESPKTGRTYSETEVTQIRAAADRRDGENRQAVAQSSLRAEVAEAETAEQRTQQGDQRLVDQGDLTQSEADRRSSGRIREAGESIRTRTQQREQTESMQGMLRRGDEIGRLVKTEESAKEHNIPLTDLLEMVKTKNPSHPDEIDLLAREMVLSKREASAKGTEHYDGNRSGATRVSLDDMSPEEMITAGLNRRSR